MSFISIDNSELKSLEAQLAKLRFKALPHATKQGINAAAFLAREKSQFVIGKKMIERNKFTRNSVKVNPSKTLKMTDQSAEIGSVEDYMETQEYGGTVRGKRGNKAIATSESAGQTGRPRTKLPTRANQLKNIRLKRKVGGKLKSKKQRTFLTGLLAANDSTKYVYMETRRAKGIFKIKGEGKKKGRFTKFSSKMMWDMSRKQVHVRKRPWLKPGVQMAQKTMPDIMIKSLKKQIARWTEL